MLQIKKSCSSDQSETMAQIAVVIDKTNQLEDKIFGVLIECAEPVDGFFFLFPAFFHNSIMSLGAKILLIKKIIKHFEWDEFKKDMGKFDEIIQLRNAFAHTPSNAGIMEIDRVEDTLLCHTRLHVDSKQGAAIQHINRKEAFDRFNKAYDCADSMIGRVIDLVRNEKKDAKKSRRKSKLKKQSSIA